MDHLGLFDEVEASERQDTIAVERWPERGVVASLHCEANSARLPPPARNAYTNS